MNSIKQYFSSFASYITIFFKWVLLALLVGVGAGAVGSVFHILVDKVTHIRMENTWLIYLLPLAGVVISFIYAMCKKYGKLDTNRIIKALRTKDDIPLILVPLIFISTVITHLFGGSAGREGAALQIGGGLGYHTGRLFRLPMDDRKIMIMVGMSAVFTAVFGTPLTAAVFAIEVSSVGIMHYSALLPCVVSAFVASHIQKLFGLSPVKFSDVVIGGADALTLLKIVALAALCAVVSIVFCIAIKGAGKYFKKLAPNRYIKSFAGGALLVLLTVLTGTYDYNGAGMDIIENALSGNAHPEAFAIKILFTAITIGAGFKGGEIIPAFFVGSTLGCVAAPVLGIEASIGAAIGFVTFFCCVVNCPLASIMLAFEVFGGNSLMVFALCCAVGYMLSGNFSLYKSQKIVYSKLNEHYADVNEK